MPEPQTPVCKGTYVRIASSLRTKSVPQPRYRATPPVEKIDARAPVC